MEIDLAGKKSSKKAIFLKCMCKFKETRIAKATLKRNKARDLMLFYIEINYKDTAIKISDSGTRIDKRMNGTEESVQKSAHMHLVT